MPRESLAHRRERAGAVIERLSALHPAARIELRYQTPLELLVAVVLSAQCTDARVNQVTPGLFARFPSAQAYAAARPAEVEAFIRSCGLYRSKAKNLVALGKRLLEVHGGEVPSARAALETLPGVGRKTAGVVCIQLGSEPALPVDTHVLRIARRLGLSSQRHPDKVEADLQALLPPAVWGQAHHLLIWHGRRTCTARAPACGRCPVAEQCPQRGVAPRPRPRAPSAPR